MLDIMLILWYIILKKLSKTLHKPSKEGNHNDDERVH
jgi:hypothetical protein